MKGVVANSTPARTPPPTGHTNDETSACWIVKVKNFFSLKIILLSRVSKNKNKNTNIFSNIISQMVVYFYIVV